MKKIFMILAIAFLIVGGAFAQSNAKEISNLREHLKISDTEPIRLNTDIKLPAGNSLKIFLMVERQGAEAKRFEKWVQDWNKKDAAKFGKLEIASDISQADIVLAHFVSADSKLTQEQSLKVGNTPPGQIKPEFQVEGRNDVRLLSLPVYSYLLVREDTFWTIVYQEVDSIIEEEQLSNPENRLWRAVKNRMKNR